MTEIWRPLGFEGSDAETYDALHDGVPDWMAASFWEWMKSMFTHSVPSSSTFGGYSYYLKSDLVRQVERKCRIEIGHTDSDLNYGMTLIRTAVEEDGAELRVADFLLKVQPSTLSAQVLATILEESGSMWKVGERAGSPGLVRRVPEAVQSAVDAAITSGGHAGRRLGQAWEAVFGIDPNPSFAYSLAVKAVEDSAIPVVSPNDTTATLGKINSQMRNTGDWSLPLQREDEHAPTSSTLLSMMKMLWAGQADRHGGQNDPDLVITQEAAEVAVMTAATLVQWFTSGAVHRADTNG